MSANTSFLRFLWLSGKESFWLSWVKARLLPPDFSEGLAGDDWGFTVAAPIYESQSQSVPHLGKLTQVGRAYPVCLRL